MKRLHSVKPHTFSKPHGSVTLNKALWGMKRESWSLVSRMLFWGSCSKGLAKELALPAAQPPSAFLPRHTWHVIPLSETSSYQHTSFMPNFCHWVALSEDESIMVIHLPQLTIQRFNYHESPITNDTFHTFWGSPEVLQSPLWSHSAVWSVRHYQSVFGRLSWLREVERLKWGQYRMGVRWPMDGFQSITL